MKDRKIMSRGAYISKESPYRSYFRFFKEGDAGLALQWEL